MEETSQSQWTPLSEADVAELKAQEFTGTEVCYIIRIPPPRLHEWHRRGLVPEPRALASRGFRRKYRFFELAHLAALRILAARGVRLDKAAQFCELVLRPRIADSFDVVCAAKSIPEAERGDSTLMVVYPIAEEEGRETYDYQVFINGVRVRTDRGGGESIGDWMVRDSITNAVVIRLSEVALDLRFQMQDVLTYRGTRALDEMLEDYLAPVRRPKAPARSGHKSKR